MVSNQINQFQKLKKRIKMTITKLQLVNPQNSKVVNIKGDGHQITIRYSKHEEIYIFNNTKNESIYLHAFLLAQYLYQNTSVDFVEGRRDEIYTLIRLLINKS